MNGQKIEMILETFREGKSQKTIELYLSDLESFREYLGVRTLKGALGELFSVPQSQANLTIMHFRSLMHEKGLKPATINRRLSALRSVVKIACRVGFLTWQLDICNEKTGVGIKNCPVDSLCFERLLDRASCQKSRLKSTRDVAVLRLMNDLALQISSVVQLNLSDLDMSRNRMIVKISGSKDRIIKILPEKTVTAIEQWLAYRGRKNGPLFTNCDHAGKGKRLTANSIYRIVRQLGRDVGVEIGPLVIRQAAILKALEKAKTIGLTVKDVAVFSDHQHVHSLKAYERQRVQIQKRLADLVSD